MKHLNLLLLCAVLLAACDHRKKVEIWIENSGDPGDSIEFSSFLNDSLVDRRTLVRDSAAPRISSYVLYLPAGGSGASAGSSDAPAGGSDVSAGGSDASAARSGAVNRFRFVVNGALSEARCTVYSDSIVDEAFIVVAFVDRGTMLGGMWPVAPAVNDRLQCKLYYR